MSTAEKTGSEIDDLFGVFDTEENEATEASEVVEPPVSVAVAEPKKKRTRKAAELRTQPDTAVVATDVVSEPATAEPAISVSPVNPEEPSNNSTDSTQAISELFFDIETIPDASRAYLFDLEQPPLPPNGDEWKAYDSPVGVGSFIELDLTKAKDILAVCSPPATWLDAVEVAEKGSKKPRKGMLDLLNSVREYESDYQAACDQLRKKMALCPEYCQIVAIGWAEDNKDPRSGVRMDGPGVDDTEAQLLEHFWDLAYRSKKLVGFNVAAFDLPVIMARSIILGVKPSRFIDRSTYKNDVLDLYVARFGSRQPSGQPGSLKVLAKLYGIDVPAGDVDGSQVEELFRKDRVKLSDYVKSDVLITRQLRNKWRGLFC